MATNPLSPDGKWMLTPDGWVFLDSDPSKTPDGQWNFTNGRFVHAQHIADEYIDDSVHLASDIPSNEPLTQALVSTSDSVIMGDVNVTVNQGPSISEFKQMMVEILSQVGASTFQTPTNVSDAHRKLITDSINSYDQLISEGAVSDPATELMVATAANVKGDYDDARRRLGELLVAYPESTEADDAIQVLAQISMRLSDWDEAEEWVEKAMDRFKTNGNWEGLGKTYSKRATILSEKGEHQSAIEMYEAAVDIAKRRNMPILRARSLANLGFFLNQVGRSSEAKDTLRESLQLARSIQDTPGALMITQALSEMYEREGNKVEASRLLRESRADLRHTDDKYILAEREFTEAKIQEKRNNLQMARGRYAKAERMFSDIGVKNKQGEVCIAIAELEDEEGEHSSAIEWYTKAMECFQEPPRPMDRMHCLAELGGLYLLRKEYAESIKSSSLAIVLASQSGSHDQQLSCLINLGWAQMFGGDIEGAKKTLITAKNIAQNHDIDNELLAILDAKLASTQR